MPENPKQQNRQTNASESDEFWALDTILPEKKITPPPALPDTAPEDVFLAMADGNLLTVYPMESRKRPTDLTDK